MILGRTHTVSGRVLDDLRAILDREVIPHSMDEFGFTELHRVCVGLSDESSETVILQTPRSRFNDGDATGRTPLSWAAQTGNLELVRRLLSLGADPNRSDYSGKSSLHWALATSVDECLQVLLEAKAKVDAIDMLGRTPLCLAVQAGTSFEFVKKLLIFGADAKSKDRHT